MAKATTTSKTALADSLGLSARVFVAARWTAALVGIVAALPAADRLDRSVVFGSAVVVFFAAWRTIRPEPKPEQRPFLGAIELCVVATAVGATGAWRGPYTSALIVAAGVAGVVCGWRLAVAAGAIAVGLVFGIAAVRDLAIGSSGDVARTLTPVALAMGAGIAVRLRGNLFLRVHEADRLALARRIEANELLVRLTDLTRSSGPVRETPVVAEESLQQLMTAVAGTSGTLALRSDVDGSWHPIASLPVGNGSGRRIDDAADGSDPVSPPLGVAPADLELLVASENDGKHSLPSTGRDGRLLVPLHARKSLIGAAVIVPSPNTSFAAGALSHAADLAESIGLAIDTARWYRRLASLSAEDERTRVARDLHDRLGTSVAYLAFELERQRRKLAAADEDGSLAKLHDDARATVRELRDTLWQLRTGVTPITSLADLLPEMADRFESRTAIDVQLTIGAPPPHLTPMVEQELLRIAQEALNNVERHSAATSVEVGWLQGDWSQGDKLPAAHGLPAHGLAADGMPAHGMRVDRLQADGLPAVKVSVRPDRPIVATLFVRDNGRGFDPDRVGGAESYGTRGMRERADTIAARLTIDSSPGHGTTVLVSVEPEGLSSR